MSQNFGGKGRGRGYCLHVFLPCWKSNSSMTWFVTDVTIWMDGCGWTGWAKVEAFIPCHKTSE